jgi:hypothetical protein
MTDCELLEAAAKAAGIPAPFQVLRDGTWVFDEPHRKNWNPLTDDGDALRLAVKLRLCIKVYTEAVIVGTDHRVNGREMLHVVVKGDDYPAATRRAIVRAAAALAPTDT